MRLAFLCLSIAAVPLVAGSGPAATSDSPVRVTVSEEIAPAGTLYRYTVTNPVHSDPIRQFWVGSDGEGPYELRQPPKGWRFRQRLPAGSARSPKGWSIEVITQEELEEVMLDWSADEPRFELQPGQSATFTVLVDKPEPTYTRSHWTVVDNHLGVTGGSFELLPLRRGRQD
jgi:hypothetical protein